MLNKVMIIGRLGRDPELRYGQSGTPFATLNVATDDSYTDRDGNRQERTEWHRVSVFNRAAESCANYLSKGSLVYVEGSLQTRKWQDQQGQDRYSTDIRANRVLFLDRKSDRDGGYPGPSYPAGEGKGTNSGQGVKGDDIDQGPFNDGPFGEKAAYQAPARNQNGKHNVYPSEGTEERKRERDPIFPSEASKMDETPF